MTTSLAGSLPYFNFRRLLIWQARHFLTYDRIVVRILSNTSQLLAFLLDASGQGVVGNDGLAR